MADQTYWLNYDATRRAGFIFEKDAGRQVLSEPAPDVALQSTTSLLADFGGDKLETSVQEAIVELGKRTTSVMMLREALYRLGEMKMNGTLDADAKELYAKILEAVKIVAVAEAVDVAGGLDAAGKTAILDVIKAL